MVFNVKCCFIYIKFSCSKIYVMKFLSLTLRFSVLSVLSAIENCLRKIKSKRVFLPFSFSINNPTSQQLQTVDEVLNHKGNSRVSSNNILSWKRSLNMLRILVLLLCLLRNRVRKFVNCEHLFLLSYKIILAVHL